MAASIDSEDPKPLAQLCHSTLAARLEGSQALDGLYAKFPNQEALRSLLNEPFVFTKAPSQTDKSSFKIQGRSEVDAKGLYLIFDLEDAVEGSTWILVNMNLELRLANEDKPAPPMD